MDVLYEKDKYNNKQLECMFKQHDKAQLTGS